MQAGGAYFRRRQLLLERVGAEYWPISPPAQTSAKLA